MTKGRVVGNVTSNLDLYPTMMEWARLDVSKDVELDGHSLSTFLFTNRSRMSLATPPDFVFGEYHSNMANTKHFMIRKGNYKYIEFGMTSLYENYKPQLFNLTMDPEEILPRGRLTLRRRWRS